MYRLGIWLIALALVFNGAPSYALDGAAGMVSDMVANMPAIAAVDHQADMDKVDAVQAECNVHPSDVAVIVTDACRSQRAAHDHLKCCPTCNVISVMPAIVAVSVPLSYARAFFGSGRFGLVGHLVALDPDIPKTVV